MEKNKIFYKIHFHNGQTILALCDANLIGKKFSDSKANLDLDTFKNFYIGKELIESDAKEIFENSDSINIVGVTSIELAKKLGYIKTEEVLYIEGVPHINIYKIFKERW